MTYKVVITLHSEFETRIAVQLPQEPSRIGDGNEAIADAVECHRFDGLIWDGAIHIRCLRSSVGKLESTATEARVFEEETNVDVKTLIARGKRNAIAPLGEISNPTTSCVGTFCPQG